MPAVSFVSGICWFKLTVKPGKLKITSFAEGVPENVIVCPATVRLRSAIVVEPVAEGVPFTEEVELIVVALRSKIERRSREKSSAVDVAVPVSVGGKDELAVSVNEPVVRPSRGRLRDGSEFVTLYGGGADPAAGSSGPIVTEMRPGIVNETLRTVDELEMVVTAALAGDSANVEAHTVDSATTPMVVRADVFSVMRRSLPCLVSELIARCRN